MAVEVLERFREAQREKARLEEQLSADLKEALKAATQEAFEQAPLIGGLYWRQDGPSFNDGDVSGFSANDPGTWSAEEDIPEFDSDEIDDCSSACRVWADEHGVTLDWDQDKRAWLPVVETDPGLSAQFLELMRQENIVTSAVFAFQEYFQELYGDDVTVRISRVDGEVRVKTSDEWGEESFDEDSFDEDSFED